MGIRLTAFELSALSSGVHRCGTVLTLGPPGGGEIRVEFSDGCSLVFRDLDDVSDVEVEGCATSFA
jgi:hypothetical protein